MLLHFLPKVLEACNQTIVEGLQLLRRLLPVDADSICQQRDLMGRGGDYSACEPHKNVILIHERYKEFYLECNEMFKDLNAIVVIRMILHVCVCKEGLR